MVATGSGDEIHKYLFPSEALTSLDAWSDIKTQLGELNLEARPLRRDDYNTGYLDLLKQLTVVGEMSQKKFEEQFDLMKRLNEIESHYYIVVLVDKASARIVAASTLFLELKFIHSCARRGRLEEVVVSNSYRGKKVGLLMVKIIVELARDKCYKLTLDCTNELINFYIKNNFSWQSNTMCIRFGS